MNIKPRAIPFRVGGPIQNSEDFVGRTEVLQAITNAIFNLQNVSLHGERRTGKTSLLFYLAHPATFPVLGLPERHLPVYFNFQEFTQASAANVWQALADAIADQIKKRYPDGQVESERFLATIAQSRSSSTGLESFVTDFGQALANLGDSNIKLHLLFDEFDQTIRNPNLGDPFYDALRSLPTRAENVSYVIATRTGLATLQPTYNKISSPFFNIFTSITLSPFLEEEAYRLIFGYFERAELDATLAERLCTESAFLNETTGFHPFFLQTLCYHLCANLDKPNWPLGQAQQDALQAFKRDSEPHFNFYWEVSSQEEQDLIKKLAANETIDWSRPENSAAASKLKDRCLIVQENKVNQEWKLFSSVFGEWVKSQIRESQPKATRDFGFDEGNILTHPKSVLRTRNKAIAFTSFFVLLLLVAIVIFIKSSQKPIPIVLDPHGAPLTKMSLTIASNPTDATVFLNGSVIGTTPLISSLLDEGFASIRIAKQGYATVDTVVEIKRDQSNLFSFFLKPEFSSTKSLSNVGAIKITSVPSGAEVFLNRRLVGNTPYEDTNVRPGKYNLILRLLGYKDYSTNITVQRGQMSRVETRLTAVGLLSITSEPEDALIVLDGATVGSTPMKIQTTVGKHQIVLRKGGFKDYSTTAEVLLGQFLEIAAKLMAPIGTLNVLVIPFGSIYIDGVLRIKDTDMPYMISLPAGFHQIKAVHPVLGTWQKTVGIEAEQASKINIDFNRIVTLAVTASDTSGKPLLGEIYVDGQSNQSFTPKELRLRVGLHTIEVRHEGYIANQMEINIEEILASLLDLCLRKLNN